MIGALILSACANISPTLAPRIALPNTPVARNFTSFSTSLRCMDQLFATPKRRSILVSSSGIPDLTGGIKVGADDMLVNAINHMNLKSQAYVFVDQSLEKDGGQLAIRTHEYKKEKLALDPQYYIRGSISQLDKAVLNDSVSGSIDLLNAPNPPTINGGNLRKSNGGNSKTLSVVTVDLHLVAYPSRRVIPGASVSNSMVVTGRGYGAGASGLIKLTGFDVSIQMNRIESQGQAVRNLIELGVLELLGRHAKVPYWDCLNLRTTHQKRTNLHESGFHAKPRPVLMNQVQDYLRRLGYYAGKNTGMLDRKTRIAVSKFQADQKLIATGEVDFDLFERLKERAEGYPTLAEAGVGKLGKISPNTKTTTKEKVQTVQYLFLKKGHSQNKRGGAFAVRANSHTTGYLICYHQQNQGEITQIFPIKSGQTARMIPSAELFIPAKNSPVQIIFETKGDIEKIGCVFDVSPLDPNIDQTQNENGLMIANVTGFDALLRAYQRKNPRAELRIISAQSP
ncbi:hypothetical protein BFP76_11325 [Amylibacter kogurei]|uniref:Peptidoglycan binding-like domain-containing protein n=1 Tax=Paramylibacter kogurei TaxID=1889778 RepID=A0A2G5KAN1_9RHOB|nr:hypothetical protein BFP76_11325 [Amylibacter kogurei]